MKEIKIGKIQSTITVIANAVWNDKKGLWEVEIHQINTHDESCTFGQGATMEQHTSNFEIKECDEFVIPMAIMKDNGIDTDELFKTVL